MFTVRFFDILTGVQSVSHPAQYNRTPIAKASTSKSLMSWFKR